MNGKIQRYISIIASIILLMVMATGCGMSGTASAEKVEELLGAYKSGEISTFAKGLEEDNSLHFILNAANSSDNEEMKTVYRKIYESTRNIEITIVGVDEEKGTINNQYVKVKIKNADYSQALKDAMGAAAETSGDAFVDMPVWLEKALDAECEVVEKEVSVKISSDGVICDEMYNEQFFEVLTGGFYDYIGLTATSCKLLDGRATYILAAGDKVVYSMDEDYEYMDANGISEVRADSYINQYAMQYEGLAGISAGGGVDNGKMRIYLLTDYSKADVTALQRQGNISDGPTEYISLDKSIEGMLEDGFECHTTDFGLGILAE